jgi:hypothetical protein
MAGRILQVVHNLEELTGHMSAMLAALVADQKERATAIYRSELRRASEVIGLTVAISIVQPPALWSAP